MLDEVLDVDRVEQRVERTRVGGRNGLDDEVLGSVHQHAGTRGSLYGMAGVPQSFRFRYDQTR